MKFSLRWLRDYAPLDVPINELVRALVDTGTEVGEVSPEGGDIVVARVVALRAVPGASRGLQFADLDIGRAPLAALTKLGITSDPLRVVTAAPNIAAGDLVAYAAPGSRPPAMDDPVGVREFLGRYPSPGMVCSEAELGVGDDASGILKLDRGVPGQPLHELLDLDTALDLEVTTNRPDCLCHVGIARELAAALSEPLSEPDATIADEALSAASAERRVQVRVDDPDGCHRFAVRVIENVSVGDSPAWLKRRLRAIGLRPINSVVDITNYVAHELGQPLHAFDLDRFAALARSSKSAEVVVRKARHGERLRCLDGVERDLGAADIVVCSADVPASLAGIIGGADTAVDERTRNVLLEAATWDGPTIRATSTRLTVRSDASTLFEKGLTDTLPPVALDRASRLIVEHSGGHVLRGVIEQWPRPLPEIEPIIVTAGFISELLGTPVDATEAATALAHLGFAVEQDGAALRVIPPAFRRDVSLPEDVVEEVGRMIGYARVPSTLPGRRVPVGPLAAPAQLEEQIRDVCVGAGLDEAITFSFIASRWARTLPGLGEGRRPIPLRNPLSEEWRVMRTSQLPGICAALAVNVKRGVAEPAMFELGRVFWEGERVEPVDGSTPDGADQGLPPLPLEPVLLTVALQRADADAAAGAIRHAQSLFSWIGDEVAGATLVSEPAPVTGLRRGRSASLRLDGRDVGLVGELLPDTLADFDLRGRVVVGELRLDAIISRTPRAPHFVAPPRVPPVQHDLAVTVPVERLAREGLATIRAAGGPLLESVELYDEYRGERVGPGRKGWTFRLTFRAPDRTLAGDEAQRVHDAIAKALVTRLGAELRT